MQTLFHDLRYGVRTLLRKPGFTFVAVITLALGIGANTAIFTVVTAVLLRPLPYPQSERMMMVGPSFGDGAVDYSGEPQFLFTREHQQAFAALALYQPIFSGVNLAGGNEAEYVEGLKVSLDFFRAVGVERVAILSADLWQRRFGADARLIGRTILVNGQQHTVVGVMPRGFEFIPD